MAARKVTGRRGSSSAKPPAETTPASVGDDDATVMPAAATGEETIAAPPETELADPATDAPAEPAVEPSQDAARDAGEPMAAVKDDTEVPAREPAEAVEPADPLETGASAPAESVEDAQVVEAADPTPESTPAEATAPPEPAPRPAPPPAAPVKSGNGGFMVLVGGIVAAALGFGLAQVVPEGWPIGGAKDQVAALESRIADQAGEIAALRAALPEIGLAERIAALEATLESTVEAARAPAEAALAETGTLRADLDEIRAALGTRSDADEVSRLQTELRAEIDALRAAIAARPDGGDLSAQLEEMRALAEAERAAAEARAQSMRAEAEARAEELRIEAEARAEALRAEAEAYAATLQQAAEESARAALVRGAVLRIQAAVDAGSPFADALEELQNGGVTVPEALGTHAGGVPALAALQADFAPAAREALVMSRRTAAPEAEETGLGDRLAVFLRNQTGMRSLAPREGDDPDAVLSRAEAAVRSGDLDQALAELGGLPPEGQAAMAGWLARVESRQDTLAALDALLADTEPK